MADPLPLPPHWDPDRVGEVWRVDYAARFEDAERWREQQRVCPPPRIGSASRSWSSTSRTRSARPGFELFVAGRSGTGALDDSRRLCEFVYRNLDSLTQIVPTLDTHQALQIFHPIMLIDEEGRHPEPFTMVTAADVEAGRWRISPPAAEGLGLDADYAAGAPALLHADAGGGRQVQPHRLALPRHARRGRLRARLGGRGGALLPLDRPLGAARLPAEGRQPAHGALLDARTGGRVRPRGRAAREAKPPTRRAAASVSTRSSSPARRRATASPGRSRTCSPTRT